MKLRAPRLAPTLASLTMALLVAGGVQGCSDGTSESPDGVGVLDASAGRDGSVLEDGGSPDAAGAIASGVHVQLLAINDFHGNLEPPTGAGGMITVAANDPVVMEVGFENGATVNAAAGTAQVPAGGAAFLAAKVKALRAAEPNTLVVSAGDLVGASPLLSGLFRDEPTVAVMNALGLDFDGIGNHEFDRGVDELKRLLAGGCSLGDCNTGGGEPKFPAATFQVLAANVQNVAANQTLFPPYAVKDFGGAKVGIIGLTLEQTPAVTVEKAVEGLSFKDEVQTVNALVPALKAEGVSAIVVLVHQGGGQDALGTADSCTGFGGEIVTIARRLDPAVDVVVSGHTHAFYNCVVDGRLVTSAASFGRLVTKIDLTVDPVARKVLSKGARNVVVTRKNADPEVESILAAYSARSATQANRVIGHVTADLRNVSGSSCETPLGSAIADAQLDATKAAGSGGASFAFMNFGGIRTDILYAPTSGEAAGAVTYAEAFATQPFANNLVTMTLTGAQVIDILNQQFAGGGARLLQLSTGLTYSYSWNGSSGTLDTSSIRVNGQPLSTAATYRVTANAFLAGGGDGFTGFKAGTNRTTGIVDLDALVAWFGKNDPLTPPSPGRVTGFACGN